MTHQKCHATLAARGAARHRHRDRLSVRAARVHPAHRAVQAARRRSHQCVQAARAHRTARAYRTPTRTRYPNTHGTRAPHGTRVPHPNTHGTRARARARTAHAHGRGERASTRCRHGMGQGVAGQGGAPDHVPRLRERCAISRDSASLESCISNPNASSLQPQVHPAVDHRSC